MKLPIKPLLKSFGAINEGLFNSVSSNKIYVYICIYKYKYIYILREQLTTTVPFYIN